MEAFSLSSSSSITDVEYSLPWDGEANDFRFYEMDFHEEGVFAENWNVTAGMHFSGGGGIVLENVTLQYVEDQWNIQYDWYGRESTYPTIEDFARLTLRNSTLVVGPFNSDGVFIT